MNKEEMKTMIAETIMPNNKKAITAQSLANVLTTMAENSGEGGGDALVYCAVDGEDMELTPEQKAHNAESFKRLYQERVPMALAIDDEDTGVSVTEGDVSYAITDDEIIVFVVWSHYGTAGDGVLTDVQHAQLYGWLDADGECVALYAEEQPSGIVRTIYVAFDDETLTDEQIAYNKETYRLIMTEGRTDVYIIVDGIPMLIGFSEDTVWLEAHLETPDRWYIIDTYLYSDGNVKVDDEIMGLYRINVMNPIEVLLFIDLIEYGRIPDVMYLGRGALHLADAFAEVGDNIEFYFTGIYGARFKVICSKTTGEYIRLEDISHPNTLPRVWLNDENTPDQTAENVATFNTMMNTEGVGSVLIAIQTEVRGANGIVGYSTSYTTPTSVAVVKMINPDNESYIVVSFKSQETTVTIKLQADGTLAMLN